MPKQTYEQWMEKADDIVWNKMGCSIYDLPDFCSRDMYDDGDSPARAAGKAIRSAQE